MGSLNAMGMAEQVAEGNASLRQALGWHLGVNHYPPVPSYMIDPCIAAIELANDGEWDAEVELPEGVTYKGRPTASVSAMVEQHHLGAFLEDS